MNHKDEIKEGDIVQPIRGGTKYRVKKLLRDEKTQQVYAIAGLSLTEELLKVENIRKLNKPRLKVVAT